MLSLALGGCGQVQDKADAAKESDQPTTHNKSKEVKSASDCVSPGQYFFGPQGKVTLEKINDDHSIIETGPVKWHMLGSRLISVSPKTKRQRQDFEDENGFDPEENGILLVKYKLENTSDKKVNVDGVRYFMTNDNQQIDGNRMIESTAHSVTSAVVPKQLLPHGKSQEFKLIIFIPKEYIKNLKSGTLYLRQVVGEDYVTVLAPEGTQYKINLS